MNLLKALVLYVDQSYAKENRNIGEVYRLQMCIRDSAWCLRLFTSMVGSFIANPLSL